MSTIKQGINKELDVSRQLYECQLFGCGVKRERRFMHSFIFSYLTPGLEVHEDGETIKQLYPAFDHEQIWVCSHEHVIAGIHAYLSLLEEGTHYAPKGQ